MKILLATAIEAALAAGKEIMKIYEKEDYQVEFKFDESPLTLADRRANHIINSFLLPTEIPIISEENEQIPYNERKLWRDCWIVDPLDGTKEFIKKNDEFTVNIALTSEGKTEMGVIYAPALNLLYFAIVSERKAFKAEVSPSPYKLDNILKHAVEIMPGGKGETLKVVGSRSHLNEDTQVFLNQLKQDNPNLEILSKGSSLKFCLLAEGEAHLYPRLGPTMEWDTAAGQAICEAVGFKCLFKGTGKPVTYNREKLLNDHFIVSNER